MAPELEASLILQAEISGNPLPKKIAEKPQLSFGLELYWQAFLELNTCRPGGFGVCPIPWSVIRDYAETFMFDSDQEEALYFHVRALDNVFMKYHEDKINSKSKSVKKPPVGKSSKFRQ